MGISDEIEVATIPVNNDNLTEIEAMISKLSWPANIKICMCQLEDFNIISPLSIFFPTIEGLWGKMSPWLICYFCFQKTKGTFLPIALQLVKQCQQ